MDPLIPNMKAKLSSEKSASQSSSFTPLSKATISAVHSTQTPEASRHEGQGHKVETVKVDGVVQSIQVTCSCGEVIVIDCQYSE